MLVDDESLLLLAAGSARVLGRKESVKQVSGLALEEDS